MPKQITRLRIDEGTLVDEPANIGARVLLWKRHDPAADPVTDEDPAMATKNDDLSERVGELEDQIGDLTKANADLTEALKKAQQPSLPLQPPPGAVDAQLKKERDELQAKLKAAEDEIAKAKAPPSEPETEDLTEGLTFEQRELFETLQKRTRSSRAIMPRCATRPSCETRSPRSRSPGRPSGQGQGFRSGLPQDRQGARRRSRWHGDCGEGADRATARSPRSPAPPSAVAVQCSRPAMSGPRRKPRRCSCAPRSLISPPIRRSPGVRDRSRPVPRYMQDLGSAQ